MGESLQQMYLDDCKELRLAKPNTELVKKLPSHSSDSGTLTELDMSANVIGVKGVMALLRVIAAAPNLSHLNFKDNNLTNQCIRDLVAVLQVHPGIRVLDLSNNPLTTAAGKDLLSLAKKNTRIEDIITTDTIIRPLMTNCISHQLDRNCNRGSTGAVAFRFGDDTAQAFEVEDEAAEARRLVFGHGPDEDQSDEEQRKVHKRWSGSAGTRRKTVSSAAFNAQESREFVLAVVPKSDDEIDWLTNSLMNNALFAHLDDSADQIANLLESDGAFEQFFHGLEVVKSRRALNEEIQKGNEELARSNIRQREEMEGLQQEIEQLNKVVEEQKMELDKKMALKREIEEKHSPAVLYGKLKEVVQQSEDESDKIAEEFHQGSIDLKQFTKQYVEQRSLYHLRKQKLDHFYEKAPLPTP